MTYAELTETFWFVLKTCAALFAVVVGWLAWTMRER